MQGLLKRPGYRLYPPDSPEAAALLAEQGLSRADLDRALARLERRRGHHGPHHRRDQRGRGLRHQPRRLAPGRARRLHEPFIPLLWLKVHELLGRVPEGSTARFVKDGTLPGDVQRSASVHRIAS